jgi:hypothetical protein
MADKKRYVVEMTMYVYAKDDYTARMEAHKIEDKINKLNLNADAQVTEIGSQPFGTMAYNKLDNHSRPSKIDEPESDKLPF